MVAFNKIPSNLREPFFYAEVDPSRNRGLQVNPRAVLFGQMLAGAAATAGALTLVSSVDMARELFGAGSHLAAMMEAWRSIDPVGEVWAVPLADAGGSAAATGKITLTGPATANGTLFIYIAGVRLQQGVTSGQTAAQIATALAASINANDRLPVTAVANAAEVELTARSKGTLGNDIDLRKNYAGIVGGERDVAGVTVAFTAMSGGATDPDPVAAIAALGDEEFDDVVSPWSDATWLNALQAEFGDDAGRWSWARQLYGRFYAAKRGTLSQLATFGVGRNDPHARCVGFKDSPSPVWIWAASWAAVHAQALRVDPARALTDLPLPMVLAPPVASRFLLTEKQTLLYDGISTWRVNGAGQVCVGRSISMWRVNQHGQPDVSYLDVTTTATLQLLLRELRARLTTRFARAKIANDGTRFGPGQGLVIATPAIVRAEIVALYSEWEARGLVENTALFKAALVVERDKVDATRLNVIWPPDLVNPLYILAVSAQFQLQFAGALN